MKKRDYYVLALLFCMVVFAAFYRTWKTKPAEISLEELQVPQATSEIQPLKTDSVQDNRNKVFKAGA